MWVQVMADFYPPLCSSPRTSADCLGTWDRTSGPFSLFRLKLYMFNLDMSAFLVYHLYILIVSWRLLLPLWTPQPPPSLLFFKYFKYLLKIKIEYYILNSFDPNKNSHTTQQGHFHYSVFHFCFWQVLKTVALILHTCRAVDTIEVELSSEQLN